MTQQQNGRKSKIEMRLDETAALPDIFTEDPDAEDNQELVDELTGAKKKKKAAPPKKVRKRR